MSGSSRRTGQALAAILAVLGTAAAPARREGESPYHASGVLRGSLVRDEPASVYSPDRQDPWNRIYHLLFGSRVDEKVPALYAQKGPATPLIPLRLLERTVRVRRLEGADIPDFFFTAGGYDFVRSKPRYGRLVALLEEELREPHLAGRTVEARILFQQDLWNRFDLLSLPYADEAPEKTRRERLRDLLGRLLARTAPSRGVLEGIRPNFPEIARAFSDLVDGRLLSEDSPFREIGIVFASGRGTTQHATTARYRRFFRIYARVPEEKGGPACLETYLAEDRSALPCVEEGGLAYGTQVLLIETLLALSDTGEIVPVPLVVNVQSRVLVRAQHPAQALDLDRLPFVILHATRRALSSNERPAGGIVRLPADEPIPSLVGCFPRSAGSGLVPAAVACTQCHGRDGRHLMSTAFLERPKVELLPAGSTAAQDTVIARKRGSDEYRVLRRFFPAGSGAFGTGVYCE